MLDSVMVFFREHKIMAEFPLHNQKSEKLCLPILLCIFVFLFFLFEKKVCGGGERGITVSMCLFSLIAPLLFNAGLNKIGDPVTS